MWYYYISVVSRILKINNYSKVWCDVLIYYYDSDPVMVVLRDIYNNEICRDFNIGFYPYKLEHKFRYSGLLYDKLKCLLSYIYRNVLYDVKSGLGSSNYGDYLYYTRCRFFNREMYPIFIGEFKTGIYSVDYLPEHVAQSLYFIHP